MAEINVDELKRLDVWMKGDDTARWCEAHPAILAALERAEQLEAADKTVQAELVRLYRLETAARLALTHLEDGAIAAAMQRLSLALEGRDG